MNDHGAGALPQPARDGTLRNMNTVLATDDGRLTSAQRRLVELTER